MKVEKVNDILFRVYVYSSIIKEDCLYDDVKKFLDKFQKMWKLKGFYQVSVCYTKIGTFLLIRQFEDAFYKDTFDFKIVLEDIDIYYQTSDYFLIRSYCPLYYNDNMYYVCISNILDEFLDKLEFGEFVFGDEVSGFLKKCCIV